MNDVQLRPALPGEAQILSELCIISKAWWGYDAAFMAACREELTINAEEFETSRICVAETDGKIVGVAQLVPGAPHAVLDKLYVDPRCMGAGAGRMLFDWAVAEARAAGAKFVSIDADPSAADFYRRMGAIDDGETPSGSIPGRMLPRLRFDL